VPGRDEHAVLPFADERPVVGRAGPEAGARVDELELGQLRQHAIPLAQQLVHGAGGDGRVEAALLDRRADDDFAVLARHHVHVLGADHPLHRQLAAQPDDLSLHRPHGHAGETRPRTRAHDDAAGGDRLPGARRHGVPCDRDDVDPLAHLDARGERADEPARVDRRLLLAEQAAADRRREARLERAALGRGQPLQPAELVRDLIDLVRVDGDDEHA
jgi:hypothetical protein